MLGGALLVAVVIASYWSNRAAGQARRGALAKLDGQWLIVALSRGRMVIEEEGFLSFDGHHAVLDTGERAIYVPLGQIRWIVDPRTGSRLAGPW